MGYQEWRTPIHFFKELDREFHFTVDVAATAENALCGRYYTKEQDGLQQDWSHTARWEEFDVLLASEVVWCNPPYQDIYPWVQKAAESAKSGATCVLLLNPCTDAAWFQDFIWDQHTQTCQPHVELRFYRGRLRFLDEYGLPGPSPRHPNMIVVFRPVEARRMDRVEQYGT